jgi:hypothetical protein
LKEKRKLIMWYRTIVSLAAATVVSAACISTDAFAREGGARVGVYHGGVAHRGVYRGAYAHRGVYRPYAYRGVYRGAYVRPGMGVGAAAVGAVALGAAARANAYDSYAYDNGYNPSYSGSDYGPAYNGGTPYYYQPSYNDNPYKHWTEF